MSKAGKQVALALFASVLAGPAIAGPLMYVDDSSNNLLIVDVATGAVSNVGTMNVGSQQVTDIGFSPSGDLWAITFQSIWKVDRTTAAATFVGNHGIPGSVGNALVFGADGTLYAASGSSTNLFSINTTTGVGTSLGDMGAASGGDLAFNGGSLYLATSSSTLRKLDLSDLSLSTTIGSFGVSNMFGIATGDDGNLYGVAGRSIYTINTTTGAATLASTWAGFGTGFGQAFLVESGAPPDRVPVPASAALMLAALGGLAAVRRR